MKNMLLLIALTAFILPSCSAFKKRANPVPKKVHILDAEKALLDAAQERAIRQILGLDGVSPTTTNK